MMDLSKLEEIIKSDFNKSLKLKNQNIFFILKDYCAIKLDNFDEADVIPSTIYSLLIYLQCHITKENCEAVEKDYITNSSYCEKENYPYYTRLRDLAKEIDICASFINNNLNLEEVEEIFYHHEECFRINQNLKPKVTDFSIRFKDNTWMHLEVVSVHSKIQKEYKKFQEKLLNNLNLSRNEKNMLLHKTVIEDQDMHFVPKPKDTETTDRLIMKLKFIECYMQHIVKIKNANRNAEIRELLKEQYADCILNLLNLASEEYSENMRGRSILSILEDSLAAAIKNPISGITIGDDGKNSLCRAIEEQIINKNKKGYTINAVYKQHRQGNILLVGLRRFNFEDNLKDHLKKSLKISSNFFSEVHIYEGMKKLLSIPCTQWSF